VSWSSISGRVALSRQSGVDPIAAPRRRAPLHLLAFLALRTVKESKVALALLLLAVTAGVGFQAPNLANLEGYRTGMLNQEVLAGYGHVRVRPRRGDRFRDAGPVLEAIGKTPGVVAAKPVLILPGSVSHGPHFSLVAVTGADGGAHRPYQLVSGRDLPPGDTDGILLGERLSQTLGANLGDDVQLQVLLSTRPRLVLDDEGIGKYTKEVRGLVGGPATDHVVVSRRFLAGELGEPEAATLVTVHASSLSTEGARAIARAIDRAVPAARASAFIDDSRLLRSTTRAIGAVERIVDVMSLFAVGVPVLALLYIDALARRRQVSLLAAMGLTSGEVFTVFLLKAAIVGAIGVTLGGLLGSGLLAYFHAFPIYRYDNFVVRASQDLHFVLRPMLLVFVTTVLAGSYPAWQAARVDPSPVLRRME
jgi:putative ABC transport system permease protein